MANFSVQQIGSVGLCNLIYTSQSGSEENLVLPLLINYQWWAWCSLWCSGNHNLKIIFHVLFLNIKESWPLTFIKQMSTTQGPKFHSDIMPILIIFFLFSVLLSACSMSYNLESIHSKIVTNNWVCNSICSCVHFSISKSYN